MFSGFDLASVKNERLPMELKLTEKQETMCGFLPKNTKSKGFTATSLNSSSVEKKSIPLKIIPKQSGFSSLIETQERKSQLLTARPGLR